MEGHTSALIKEQFESLDLYAIFGIEKSSDASLITKSYRKLALKFHPVRSILNQIHCELTYNHILLLYIGSREWRR